MGRSNFWILGLGLLLIVAVTAQAQQVALVHVAQPNTYDGLHNVAQLGTATSPGTGGVGGKGKDPSMAIDDRISIGTPGTCSVQPPFLPRTR